MVAYWSQRLAPSARQLWPYAAVAATALVVAAAADLPRLLLGSALALAAVATVWYDRRLVVPIIILALPLEISKDFFPFLYATDTRVNLAFQTSIVDFGRLAIFLAAGTWLATAPANWLSSFPRSALLTPLLLLLGVYLLSLSYANDLTASLRETLRLAFNFGFFILIPFFVRDKTTLRWCLIVLLASGLALATAGLFQQASGVYFWNPELKAVPYSQVNATFANPNHFARFLNVVMVTGLALSFVAAPRRRYLFLAPILGLAALALLFTGSRSGWLTAFVVLPLLLLLSPIKPSRKVLILAAGVSGVAVGVLLLTFLHDPLAQRFETLELGILAIGPRYYLIQAGWQMFLDHPVVGVGLGAFQSSILGPYSSFIWYGYSTTLSHTALVTIMAELGLMGLALLAFLLWRLGGICRRLYRQTVGEDQAMVMALAMAFLAIFLSSQSEGRLFEDPYLWLVLGLLVALEGVLRREGTLRGRPLAATSSSLNGEAVQRGSGGEDPPRA